MEHGRATGTAGSILYRASVNRLLGEGRAGSIRGMPKAEAFARAGEYLAQARDICGDQLVACWLHGGSTFVDPCAVPGDVDVCVVVAEAIREQGQRLQQAAQALNVDGLFVRADDMSRPDRPSHAFQDRRPLVGWAVYRAHWLAGQYVPLAGREPRGWVLPPRWADLVSDLDREVEHFERHVLNGDAEDPYETTAAHLNGCRVLYTTGTRDAVISKRASGKWGRANLPETWRPAIDAALRCYDGEADSADITLLRASMPRFVSYVRDRVPVVEPRHAGPPRWS